MKRVYENHEAATKEFWSDFISSLNSEKYSEIVIFGCGELGSMIYKYSDDSFKDKIACYSDNNKNLWGSNKEQYRILSPSDAVNDYPAALFVVAIGRATADIQQQLIGMGINSDNIKLLNISEKGMYDRKYFKERLSEEYYIDDSFPSESVIPVIKNKNSNDERDFRIYIENGLIAKLDIDDSNLEYPFMDEYEKHYGKYIRLDRLPTDCETNTVKVLISCCHKDLAPLEKDSEDIYVPIQVGKALTDIDIYDLKDDTGVHISDRNYNYCECTALYWAWKNKYAYDADYIGLRHYRRKFEASDESLLHLKANGIDIVHLDPIYHDNIRYSFVNHTKNDNDWEVMKKGIRELFPEYVSAMEEYENQHFVCGYNMNILRRDVFDEYCEFLFGVLMYIEDYYLKICDRRDRYLGFLAENLFGVFLIKNKDKYTQAVTKLVPFVK